MPNFTDETQIECTKEPHTPGSTGHHRCSLVNFDVSGGIKDTDNDHRGGSCGQGALLCLIETLYSRRSEEV